MRAQRLRREMLFFPRVLRVRHVLFIRFLPTGEDALRGVDHNDEITGIHVRGECRLVLPAEDVGGANGHFADDLIIGVDDVPPRFVFFFFGKKCLHKFL